MYFDYKTNVSPKIFQMTLNVENESKEPFELKMKYYGRDYKSTAVTRYGRA